MTPKERKAAYQRARQQTPERKAAKRARQQTPERKAAKRARQQTPERKAYMRAYEQTPERKAAERAYEQTPERKAAERARQQAAGAELCRLFRAARESLPGSQFKTECEDAGFHHLAARSLIAQANIADGIVVPERKPRGANDFGISKTQAKAILAMRDDPDSLFAALEEVVAS